MILSLILIFGVALFIAIKIAKAVQREVDKVKTDKKRQARYHWLGSIHYIWMAVIPAAKYVYREWKTAPPNSAEKFFWTMVLAATCAVAAWILMKILDKLVNKDSKPAVAQENARIR